MFSFLLLRFGLNLENLREIVKRHTQIIRPDLRALSNPNVSSTCSDFSTQRGTGQKILSYSFYNPTKIFMEGIVFLV